MLQRFLLIALILCSFSASAQWQQTGSKVRYVNGIGIPTKDTAAGVSADSSQILIRPADSSLYVKYKRTWMRVGGGGGSIAGGGTFNYIPKFSGTSSIGNSLIYDDGSLIGIGTATPNSFLDVRGSATFKITSPRILIEDNDNNGTASIWFRPQNASFNTRGAIDLISAGSGAAGEFRFSAGATGGTGNAAHYMSFYTAALERMRIDNAGNVGIGTTSPSSQLEVSGSGGTIITTNSTNSTGYSSLLINSSGVLKGFFGYGTYLVTGGGLGIRTASGVPLSFSIGSATESMFINTSGNVGIGTTSPAAKLSVQGTTLINTNTDNGTDKLQVSGSISGIGMKQNYVTKTGAYTATDADYVIDCTSGTFTVTLPASSGRTGRILIIKNSGAGTITVDGNAAETIDGAATYSLSVQYATIQIVSDGTNWKIISKF